MSQIKFITFLLQLSLLIRTNTGFLFADNRKTYFHTRPIPRRTTSFLRGNPDRSDYNSFLTNPCHPYGCNLNNTTTASNIEPTNKTMQLDFVGAGTLGDIMSTMSTPDNQKYFTADLDADKNIDDENINKNIQGRTPWNETLGHQSLYLSKAAETKTKPNTSHRHPSLNSGLVTTTGGTLQSEFAIKMNGQISPLERIALTANGNLQRIFSSYYDAPVHVIVDKCHLQTSSSIVSNVGSQHEILHNSNQNNSVKKSLQPIRGLPPIPAIWDRSVHLSVHDQKFCTAYSQITVNSKQCIELVCSGKVGIGQIFRYLDKLPTFELLDAGRLNHGGMWREYSLSCVELTCHIREEFSPNAWNIAPMTMTDV